MFTTLTTPSAAGALPQVITESMALFILKERETRTAVRFIYIEQKMTFSILMF